jgi:hypothetical protein
MAYKYYTYTKCVLYNKAGEALNTYPNIRSNISLIKQSVFFYYFFIIPLLSRPCNISINNIDKGPIIL